MTTFIVTPIFASALDFAFKQATIEGKCTIGALVLCSIFSWVVIFNKSIQLYRAIKGGRKFFAAYRETRDPLDIYNRKEEFDGAPAYDVYFAGCEELAYQLKNNPVHVTRVARPTGQVPPGADGMHTDVFARNTQTKISGASFDSVKVVLERETGNQALSLEKGMIILSTAVAGGPFIGLLGTVWGVMETFSGIARAASASLTAMAPGVAGALIATVTGLFVAIPAMFAYNYMITTIRTLTQQMDGFASEFATAMEHRYVDNRSMADEMREALRDTFPAQRSMTATYTDPARQSLPQEVLQ